MKQYGPNKATSFSKKQVNVVYGMAKRGEIKIQKFVIKDMYDLADYYGYDSNGSVEMDERHILNILNAVFNGTADDTQKEVDHFTEHLMNTFTEKRLAKADMALV